MDTDIGSLQRLPAREVFEHEAYDSLDALWRYANLYRVQSVIRPYMEAVTTVKIT